VTLSWFNSPLRLVDVMRGCRDATDSEDGLMLRYWPGERFPSRRWRPDVHRAQTRRTIAREWSSPAPPTVARLSTTPKCPSIAATRRAPKPTDPLSETGGREAQFTRRSAEGRWSAVEQSVRGSTHRRLVAAVDRVVLTFRRFAIPRWRRFVRAPPAFHMPAA
jgi:hypothetical protein